MLQATPTRARRNESRRAARASASGVHSGRAEAGHEVHGATPDGAIDWESLAPRRAYARLGRPLLQLTLLALILPVAGPLCILIAAVNWACFRDLRKIFYMQPRVGYRRRAFQIYKFRTMRETGDSAHDSWSAGAEHLRVTAFGRFLRSTHLDELPQLLNIARGEMNIIGPRPEMVEIEDWASAHVVGFSTRLAVKPGITGWAQITQGYTGRSVEAYALKLAINDRYRREVSLAVDLAIIGRTIVWMLRGKGWSAKSRPPTSRKHTPRPRPKTLSSTTSRAA